MTTLFKVHLRFGENELKLEGDREFVTETFRDFKEGFFNVPMVQQIQAGEGFFSVEDEIKTIPN